MNTRYWIGVVSQSHVVKGVEGGFAQLCHGKCIPLKRMNKGDWLIYYSPKTDMSHREPLQMFTAVGRVAGDSAYQFEMASDFIPFRRDIAYLKCKPTSIKPLIEKLSFIKDPKRWGFPFRAGHFEIKKEDFLQITKAMQMATNE
jgi:hypothetical protein